MAACMCSRASPMAGQPAASDDSGPPAAPVPWAGIRDALALGPSAPAAFGVAADTMKNPDIIAMIEGAAEYVPSSEDCLVLNVWTTGPGEGRTRPVMVWCHGGGFFAGSGGGKWNDGTNLARHGDVVVVSFNHRLNILGFLYLAELGGADYADSGNAGMLDVVAALEWVRDNIAEFGGDPRQRHCLRPVGRRLQDQRADGDAGRAPACSTRRSSRAAR